jgi:hypothetical protein
MQNMPSEACMLRQRKNAIALQTTAPYGSKGVGLNINKYLNLQDGLAATKNKS